MCVVVVGTPTQQSSELALRKRVLGTFVPEISQLTCGIRLKLTVWSSTPGSPGEGSLLLGGPLGV